MPVAILLFSPLGLAEADRRRLYGASLIAFGLLVAGYFFLVLDGAIEPQGRVTTAPDSAGFVAFAGLFVAITGLGHVARLDEEDMEFLYMFSGGVLLLLHTVVLIGDPLSPSPAKGAYRYPPLYGTILAVVGILLPTYLRYYSDS